MDFQHKPVLLTETLRFWTAAASGVYMDGTLGGGGHSAALLELLPQALSLIHILLCPRRYRRRQYPL